MTFRLTKHHGLGNDFLILLTDDASAVAEDEWWRRAQRWCDRTTGIGAHGLILGLRGQSGSDLEMTLYNDDGSRAEMSGNGIRCLAQAEAMRRHETKGRLLIETDGGPRAVDFVPADGGLDDWTVQASVDMGPARPGPAPNRERDVPGRPPPAVLEQLALDAKDGITFDVGNPHLVLLVEDPEAVDPVRAGMLYEATYDDGMNVHFVAPTRGEDDAMDMVVWERGAGLTGACGTGATAVARAAHDWGLTGDRVTVHMPGGDVVVDVGDSMTLHGPATYVVDITVPS